MEDLSTGCNNLSAFPTLLASADGSVFQISTQLGFVYQIQARVLPYLSGSVYLLRLDDDWIVVDVGSGDELSNADIQHGFETIRSEFESSFSVESIRYIILTHCHIDHFGGAAELQRRSGAEIWVHTFESRLVTHYDVCARVEDVRYQRFLLEAGVYSEEVRPILDGFGFYPGRVRSAGNVARRLLGGEELGPLKFYYLPGHSSGHLAFTFGNVIFSGDLLLSKTLTQIWPTRMTPQTGMVNYIYSLKKLEEIALEHEAQTGSKLTALPAHEGIVFDVPTRVEQALRGTERRNQRLLRILSDSDRALSLAEITRKMYWSGRPNREFFALSDVGSRVELLLQLGLLEVVGSENVTADSPTLYYKPSFADTEFAKNTVQQVVRMYLAGNKSNTI